YSETMSAFHPAPHAVTLPVTIEGIAAGRSTRRQYLQPRTPKARAASCRPAKEAIPIEAPRITGRSAVAGREANTSSTGVRSREALASRATHAAIGIVHAQARP